MKKLHTLTLALLTLTCFAAAACETVKGAGRDIEHAGQAVQDAMD